MDETIDFNKSYEDRLEDYVYLLKLEDQSLLEIKNQFSYSLESSVNGVTCCVAIWNVPQSVCKQRKVQYPSFVLVYIEDIDTENLTASIQILAVKDKGLKFPSRQAVDIIELCPTKKQVDDIDRECLYTFAETVDMIRFFYEHILMPWEWKETNPHWLTDVLDIRLNLYLDMINGTLPTSVLNNLNFLLSEAKYLKSKIIKIEQFLLHDDGDNDNWEKELTNLQIRMVQIRNEFELYENPITRLANVASNPNFVEKNEKEPNIWIVFSEGTIEEHTTFLQEIETIMSGKILKFWNDLITALDYGYKDDIFILSPTTYEIKSYSSIQKGGILKGLNDKHLTRIYSKNEDTMLEFNGGDVVLENLTIDASVSKFAIIISTGNITIKNCKIFGTSKQGITIFNNSKLEIVDSEVTGFQIGIACSSESVVLLKNCKIHSVNIGLKIFNDCHCKAQKLELKNCSDYGIYYETDLLPKIEGDFSLLNLVPNFEFEEITGENNLKGDVSFHNESKVELNAIPVPASEYVNFLSPSEQEDYDLSPSNDSIDLSNTTVIMKNL